MPKCFQDIMIIDTALSDFDKMSVELGKCIVIKNSFSCFITVSFLSFCRYSSRKDTILSCKRNNSTAKSDGWSI